ncbi:MAG: imidazole glycerol phosphate synthase subunit HisH [Acidobacteriota bacterium]|nr:imidazole glycerol phosphate synthase subunit HisH [Acidobacteriota bacterium]
MPDSVAIVDYGLGNLFSVRMACEQVGMAATVTSVAREILTADAVILPGVGAFGDAMAALERLDLVAVILDAVAQGKPLFGVCLGFQLLMSESEEFGIHRGLGVIEGRVRSLGAPTEKGRRLKVPQVGWNQVRSAGDGSWEGTALAGVADGGYMYFVHSYIVEPSAPEVVLSTTRYGDVEFCSSAAAGSVFGCQFHPERSGAEGLLIYSNLRARVGERIEKGAAQ